MSKKILLAYPNWDNRWIPYFTKALAKHEVVHFLADKFSLNSLWDESRKADILLSMWASEVPMFWTQYFPDKKIITYLRRYEFFNSTFMGGIKWQNVSAVIFVNEVIKEAFEGKYAPRRTYYIPNGVDLDQFPLAKRDPAEPRTKIAFVCSSVEHKNFGLAAQILLALPEAYTIHHIGKMPSRGGNIWTDYFKGLGIGDRWIWYDKIPAAQMPAWYADKDFILSTSISEGNPNNVIEGMACGLRPVVHRWPGADEQFPGYTFSTVGEAVSLIKRVGHLPEEYRMVVKELYSLENINKINDVIEAVCQQP